MKEPFERFVIGSIAGFAATAPMTGLMVGLHHQLPPEEKYPLPPRQITEEMADTAGVEQNLDESDRTKLALVNHFAYGALMGGLYGAMPPEWLRMSPVARGIAYGLGVWAANYLGLLPAVGSQAAAHEESLRRNALMIAAHVVWGGSLGIVTHALLMENANASQNEAQKAAASAAGAEQAAWARKPDEAAAGAYS